MSDALIRPGRAEEAGLLSDLALWSKGDAGGYDATFFEACRAELTLTPETAARAAVNRARHGRLEMLFLDPDTIGTGVGRLLYDDAVQRARSRGWRSMVLDADPGAESFYLRMGARRIGETPSNSIPGRVLPVLEIEVFQ